MDLLGDMVLRNADGTMILTLGNLINGGIYEITTYHHSSNFGGGTFDINITDADRNNAPLFASIPVSDTTTPSTISTVTFGFISDDDPVQILRLGGAGSEHLSLNGFDLQFLGQVPEPSSTGLLGIGLAGIAARQRRRRRG